MTRSRRHEFPRKGDNQSRLPGFRSSGPVRSRAGFTLWEMLLVVVLLLMVASVAWPAISRLFAQDRLQDSLSLVQLKFNAARIRALEEQIPYQFCYEPGGRRFVIVPARFAGGNDSPSSQNPSKIPWVAAEELPEEFHIESRTPTSVVQTAANIQTAEAAGPQTIDFPEEWFAEVDRPERFRGVTWSPPILIQPDGSATAAEFVLVDESEQEHRFLVRSITGTLLMSGQTGGGRSE